MALKFEWDGPVLKGPIDTRGKFVQLPSGPSSAAPFHRPGWELGFGQGPNSSFALRRGSKPSFAAHTTCRVRIINGRDPTNPPPIDFLFRADSFKSENTAVQWIGKSYEAHLNANSRLEMFVFLGDLPPPPSDPSKTDSVLFTPTTAAFLWQLTLSPIPYDVRFTFPRSGRDLWASATILRKASSYLDNMLRAGFTESQTDSCTYTGPMIASASGTKGDWSDSDEDEVDVVSGPSLWEHPLYSITITDYSFATYHAVWVWILTHHIDFAPFSALPAPLGPTDTVAEPDGGSPAPEPPLKRPKTEEPSAPLPPLPSQPGVSPKSVYRLAHLLELEDLEVEALAAFRRNLTVDNVAHQLFSSTADLHDEVRAAAAEYAVAHWDEVEKTAAMVKMLAKVDAREADQGGVVMRALAKASLAKSAKR